MIPCKHCNTLNSLDSTFCKRCGTGLPEDEVTAGKEKLEKAIAEGVHALNIGKVEEAMAIADMAVASDPSMISAFTLKASVHERRGEIAEALEAQERVVELNPDSELDKIKRNQLRAALGASALRNQPPSRMVAGVAAASVVAIVLCAAVLTAKYVNRTSPQRVAMTNPPIRDLYPSSTQDQTQTSGQSQATPPQNQGGQVPAAGQQTQTGQGAVTPNVQFVPPTDEGGPDDGSVDSGTPSLPPAKKRNPDPTVSPEDLGKLTPVDPKLPAGFGATTPNNQQASAPRTNTGGNEGLVAPTADTAATNVVTQAPPPDPGQIEIHIHSDGSGGRARGNSGSGDPKDTSKVFMRMGNDFYQMGNYSGAASNLEKAVSSGADPVRANYRLAQSYNSMGRKSDAIDAYKRTIAACTSSLNSGKGDAAKLRATRDAAETALRQLQGG